MAKQAITILLIVLVFGIFVPWYKGFDFLDPLMISAYSCLAIIFVAPASAEAFGALPAESSRSELLAKLFTIVAYGWGVSIVILASGIITVNLSKWHGRLLLPRTPVLLSCLLLSLTGALAFGSAAALLARRTTPRSAKSILRLAFLLILLSLAFGNRYLPIAWRSSIETQLTTEGITTLALRASMLLAIASVFLILALLRSNFAHHPSATM
jgi:ABC-2 type transport system permease protein